MDVIWPRGGFLLNPSGDGSVLSSTTCYWTPQPFATVTQYVQYQAGMARVPPGHSAQTQFDIASRPAKSHRRPRSIYSQNPASLLPEMENPIVPLAERDVYPWGDVTAAFYEVMRLKSTIPFGSATIYLSRCLDTDQLCVEKRCHTTDPMKGNMVTKARFMRELRHPNVISLVETAHESVLGLGSHWYEWCQGGSLDDIQERFKERGLPIPERFIWVVLIDILAALAWCHLGLRDRNDPNEWFGAPGWKPIIHRDIKLSTIYIKLKESSRFDVVGVLGNFMWSVKPKEDTFDAEWPVNYTSFDPPWQPPEAPFLEQLDGKCDVWNLCTVIQCLCYGLKEPDPRLNGQGVGEGYSRQLDGLIRRGTAPPEQRWTSNILLRCVADTYRKEMRKTALPGDDLLIDAAAGSECRMRMPAWAFPSMITIDNRTISCRDTDPDDV